MKGFEMRKLFVKGEVINCIRIGDKFSCIVNFTNDGYHVCQKSYLVRDENELQNIFYEFIETDKFQQLLRG